MEPHGVYPAPGDDRRVAIACVHDACESCRSHLSCTPARTLGSAPTLGRDTHVILSVILGYDDKKFAELLVAGALE